MTHPYTGTAFTAIDATTFDALNRAVVAIVNCTTTGTTPPADPSTCTGAGTHDAATNLTTRTAYDAAGHTLAVLDAKGITTRTFVNARGQTTETLVNCTDSGTTPPGDPAWRTCAGLGTHDKATNQETDTTYDGSGAVFSSVQTIKSGVGPDTSPTSYAAYDGAGRQIAARDARGAVTITAYDASGRVASTTVNCTDSGTSQPAGPPSPAWITCAGAGTHDASANLVTSYTYDSRGNKATATAPNGKLTTYSYDDANHLIKVIDNDVPSPSTPDQDVTTEYHYDAAGRQDAVKGPTGTVSINVYDTTTGRLTKAVVNCLDSPPPTSWWACSGNGTKDWQTNLTTSYTYDAAGRKVSETKPDPSAPQSGTGWDATVTTRYAYNETGQLCRVLEVASVDLQALAVPCTTPVSGTTSTNLSTQYAYDDAGNLATMIDASGHTTSYGYDKAGHMTSLTDADGATQWGYDNAGNRISQTNRTPGSTITWTYDSSGRMTTRLADGTTVTYGYDLDGNRTSAGDGTRTVSSTYDPLNRPLAVTTSDDPGAGTTYTYSFTSPSWADPTGAYLAALDPMGWQTGLTEPAHPGSPFTFTYRADGQPATVTAPSTTADTTTYAYDAAGRLSSKTTTRGGPSIASYAWTVNAAGNRRAESSTITGDPANGSTAFAYDQAGRLTGYTPPAGLASQAYGWDRVPNRTSLTVGTNPAITTAFDAANRPQADTPGGAYATDLDGRVTGIPAQGGVAARSLAHDSLGRLTSVVVGGITRSYAYDPLDRLYSVSTGGVTTERFRYVGLTSSMAQTLDGSGAVTRSFGTDWSGAHLLDWTGTGSDVRFYGTNGHGDLAWTADSTGAPTAMLHYDPYGTLVASTGTSLPDVRFQGSWADDTTKLSWANARWYAPSMGTFLTEDSLLGQTTEPSSRQLYAYGAGDPVDRVDPGGQFWFLTTIGSTNLVRLSSIYYGNVLFTDRLRTANNLSGWFVEPGRCIWIPGVNRPDQCRPPKSNVIRYAPSLINYRWSVSRSTPMVQANMGPIFVRAYGVYVLTVGQGSPKIPSITASTTGLGISNSVSTFQISPTGQVVMMGGAPIRIAGWRGATGPGQSLPGSAHTVEGWHAVNALYGLGFCPEVCYQWETRWSRELYLDGVYFGTPMYVKADVRLHVNMGYEFWSYPAAPAAAFALATSWQFLAGLSLVLPMLQPALSR